MMPFTTLTAHVAHLPRDNVDTDTIIPSREMTSTGRTGLADGLFAPWRYREGRVPDPDFVLNRMPGAQILASGANFGCGSSREHAVWALAEWGIRVVIAESFAPIFRNNCVRNGVVPVVLSRNDISKIAGREVIVDLSAQTVDGRWFEIDAEAKAMLIEGLDAIDLTLKHVGAISSFHVRDRAARPWVYLDHPPRPKEGEETRDAQRRGGGVSFPRLRKSAAGVQRARALRRQLSPSERRLWSVLRERPGGLKFRSQHPADPYTLDFYCSAARLCIEVDGAFHDRGDRPQRDAVRDRFMAQHQIATVRIPAVEIHRDLDAVVRHIVNSAAARIPLHPDASRRGSPPQAALGEER